MEETKKLIGPNGEKLSIRLVTKEIANHLLEKNTGNRRIKEKVVEKYVRDMKSGNWLFNGEPILITNEGEILADGQHRLLAIIESEIPQPTVILEGVSKEVVKTIDQGCPRSQADALCMLGVSNSKLLTAVAKKVLSQMKGILTKSISYSVEELYKEIVESSRAPYYEEAVDFSKSIFSQYRIFPKTTLGMMYVLLKEYGYSQDIISDFFDQLVEKKESCISIKNLKKGVRPDADRRLSVEERERLLIRTFNEFSNGNNNYYVYNLRNKKSKVFVCQP